MKPQDLYAKKAIRALFDRLAHASIMRLNTQSMDKVGTQNHTKSKIYKISLLVLVILYHFNFKDLVSDNMHLCL